MSSLGSAYVQIVPTAKGIGGELSNVLSSESAPAGQAAGQSIAGKIKGVLAKAAIGATVVAGLKKSISEGAALEQSIGGIETLFKGSADSVIKNARQAFKTAGVSANEYMENVTSFSAGLIKAMNGDTAGAAKVADTAMKDMSDNANKMGTDIESIQNAYQGFAKQNYTMLDNLKLGYGGTKEEMQRLLEDAGKLSGQEYDMSNLNDVYEAIHVVQEEMGITGTTANEAATTISGSLGMMKAAFSDLMGNLAMGENVGPAMKNLVDSAVTFLMGNLIPAIGRIILSLPVAISSGISTIIPYVRTAAASLSTSLSNGLMGKLPEFAAKGVILISGLMDKITENLPAVLQKGVELISQLGSGFINALPDLITNLASLINNTVDFIAANAPQFLKAGLELMVNLAKSFITNLPAILSAVGKVVVALGRGFLKLGPMGLKFGMDMLKRLGAGLVSGGRAVINAVKGVIDKITSPFRKAIDTIKGFFPIKIGSIMSNIKLPHFSVSGGKPPWGFMGKGSLPKVTVKWNAQAEDNPYLFTKATLFGAGERNDEILYGRQNLMRDIQNAVGGGNITINLNYDASADADEMIRDIARGIKRYKMAGAF